MQGPQSQIPNLCNLLKVATLDRDWVMQWVLDINLFVKNKHHNGLDYKD